MDSFQQERILISMKYCPNCGSVLDEYGYCQYCKSFADQVKEVPANELPQQNTFYREIECNEANLNFFNTIFPLIFAVSFGLFGFGMPIGMYFASDKDPMILLVAIPFGLIAIIATIIVLRTIIRVINVNLNGKEIIGTVIGYRDDNSMLINGVPATTCEILINLNMEKVVLLYQTGTTKMPYPINSKIKVKVYKDLFKVCKNKKDDYEVWNNV